MQKNASGVPKFLLFDPVKGFTRAEHQRNAPDARKTDNCINDAAEQRGLSAADPGNDVKLEQADAAPVQRTDDG